ncbi:MAG: hypothetical protein R6V27_11415, partial [Balneolaceae bacterium]
NPSPEATIVLETDSEINSYGCVKASFNSGLSGVLNIGSLKDFYLDLISSVESTVVAISENQG